jgi:hypothetical protein
MKEVLTFADKDDKEKIFLPPGNFCQGKARLAGEHPAIPALEGGVKGYNIKETTLPESSAV